MAYPYVAPPEVPADRLAALRQAFDATMKDPEFLADARQQNLDIDPVGGDEIWPPIAQRLMRARPEVIASRQGGDHRRHGRDREQIDRAQARNRRKPWHSQWTP